MLFVGVEGFEPQRRTVPDPLLVKRYSEPTVLPETKKSTDCSMLFVGVEGFEPPTLCL